MSTDYYDTSYPPSLWGGGGPAPIPATTATAGTPGTWGPAGSTPPASVAALQGSGITAIPATGWTGLQYVQTLTFGAAGEATWTGTGWVGGKAPATQRATGAARSQVAPDGPQVAQESPVAPGGTGTAQEPPEAPEAS
jgi:hypothetical protein